MILQHLTQTARNAYNGVSFSPEKRGDSIVSEYSAELETDIIKIENIAKSYNADATEHITRYKSNYEKAITNWLYAKGRCVSSMIAGPSNFPVARMQKYNNWEDNKYQIFREWRRKALKAIERSLKPPVTVDSELMRYEKELKNLERYQLIMKECNVIIRKAKGTNCTESLINAGLTPENAHKIQRPDFCGKIGFASFNLTNNSANIRRIKERIALMQSKQEDIKSGNKEVKFEGGTIVINTEVDRIQILFDAKPDENKRSELKRNGFRWAPSASAWQRQLTDAAKYATARIMNVKQGEL